MQETKTIRVNQPAYGELRKRKEAYEDFIGKRVTWQDFLLSLAFLRDLMPKRDTVNLSNLEEGAEAESGDVDSMEGEEFFMGNREGFKAIVKEAIRDEDEG